MKKANILFLVLAILTLPAYAYAEKDEIKKDDSLYSVYKERMMLMDEIKKFEKKIGFQPTNNFLNYSDTTGYPGCYIAPKRKLIYSYEDGDLDLLKNLTIEECLALNNQKTEAFFYEPEAIAEVGAPVSRSLLKAPIDRFLYVILHEDFHEQLDLPLGIEEAAGHVFALEAAKIFAKEKFGKDSREYEAMKNYTEYFYVFAREMNFAYSELEIIYRLQDFMPSDEFNLKQTQIIKQLENRRKDLMKEYNIPENSASSLSVSSLNAAYIGFAMTYVRHSAFMRDIFSKLDNDLKNIFDLFKMVDRSKPSRSTVEDRIGNYPFEYFAQEYEKIVIKEIEKWLLVIENKKSKD